MMRNLSFEYNLMCLFLGKYSIVVSYNLTDPCPNTRLKNFSDTFSPRENYFRSAGHFDPLSDIFLS